MQMSTSHLIIVHTSTAHPCQSIVWYVNSFPVHDIAFAFLVYSYYKYSRPEVFLRKGLLKICRKFTGEHPCRSVISIKSLCNFMEIAHQHGFSPVNLLDNFRTPFTKNTCGWLLLILASF